MSLEIKPVPGKASIVLLTVLLASLRKNFALPWAFTKLYFYLTVLLMCCVHEQIVQSQRHLIPQYKRETTRERESNDARCLKKGGEYSRICFFWGGTILLFLSTYRYGKSLKKTCIATILGKTWKRVASACQGRIGIGIGISWMWYHSIEWLVIMDVIVCVFFF